jgi:NADPH-dependent curcumin reductase CurA
MSENRQWVLERRPEGALRGGELRYTTSAVPKASTGQIVVRNEWLSVDPTNRLWMSEKESYLPALALGDPMRGFVIGKVTQSNGAAFDVGDSVMGIGSWSDYSCGPASNFFASFKVPGVSNKDLLGYYYHIAPTSYFGLREIGQPKIGETLVVSTAGGAVGSIVVQLGKLWGCKVIGIAGGRDKCDWIVGELGADGAIDYKSEDLAARLDALCPEGVDVFFDNVGGTQLATVVERMNLQGRVVLCGSVSSYASEGQERTSYNLLPLIIKRVRMEGFVVLDYLPRYSEAVRALGILQNSGKLKWRYEDFDDLRDAETAMLNLYAGKNRGKVIVWVGGKG